MPATSQDVNPTVRAAGPGDHRAWRALFCDYAQFGGVAVSDDQADLVWAWISSDTSQTRCLLAVKGAGMVGFVHYRIFERPITASTGLWIDDLYVRPDARGSGTAAALIDAVRAEAWTDGHDTVRWTTRENNAPARRLYDRVASRAPVVVYNASPRP